MTPPRHTLGALTFTWPSAAQIDGYYAAIVGTTLFDTLLWNGPSGPEELHAYWAARRAEQGPDEGVSLAVLAGDTMIGAGSVRPVNVPHGVWNIGYALAPAWHGRGHGTVLVGLLVHIAFAERRAERLEADVFVGNHASRRVLEKAGFTLEGTARSAVAKPDGRRDEWRFGMIRSEWRPA